MKRTKALQELERGKWTEGQKDDTIDSYLTI